MREWGGGRKRRKGRTGRRRTRYVSYHQTRIDTTTVVPSPPTYEHLRVSPYATNLVLGLSIASEPSSDDPEGCRIELAPFPSFPHFAVKGCGVCYTDESSVLEEEE